MGIKRGEEGVREDEVRLKNRSEGGGEEEKEDCVCKKLGIRRGV
jgi:hypothetical protein